MEIMAHVDEKVIIVFSTSYNVVNMVINTMVWTQLSHTNNTSCNNSCYNSKISFNYLLLRPTNKIVSLKSIRHVDLITKTTIETMNKWKLWRKVGKWKSMLRNSEAVDYEQDIWFPVRCIGTEEKKIEIQDEEEDNN